MIRQDDGRLRPEIQKYGCYYMSLLWWLNKLTNISLSAESINDGLYKLFIKKGYMDENCFILNPAAILKWGGLNVRVVEQPVAGHKLPAYFHCRKNDIEILYYKNGEQGHFVAGDRGGHVTYDPMGESKTVREGALRSKRVFRPM